MARRVHVVGFRLGSSLWWKDRTPVNTPKEYDIKKLLRGKLERFGYLTSDVLVQKNRNHDIMKLEISNAGHNPMYHLEYVAELLKKSQGVEYKISTRQEEKKHRNGELKFRYMATSPRSIRVTMRERKWKWK